MTIALARSKEGARPIDAGDLERVIAIDRAHTGHSRRRFFEKRFAAAAAHPEDFVQIGLTRGGSLRGFAIARVLLGEFGREDAVAVLDVVGVEAESQDQGVGRTLIDELIKSLRQKKVRSLHSEASWASHHLLRFFDTAGFQLSPRMVLERSVSDDLPESAEEP
jgi:ribosomal protein S18 acetylase RimI-like enzyme